MTAELLRPVAFLPPQETLAIAKLAPTLRSSLQPALSLPWPLSLLFARESPEKWQTRENLLIASLKTGDDESARLFLDSLVSRFGAGNEKVQALQGLYREAVAKDDEGELEAVLKGYEDAIREQPGNMHLRKRRVGLFKSMGRTAEAVKAVMKILDVSPTDAEAWAELGDLYAGQGLWDKAVFAWEEVLLTVPNGWNVHARLGEIEWRWSLTVESVTEKIRLVSSSLRRYCRAIELCDDYLRGYYGLKLTSGKLLELLGKTQKSSGFDVAGDLAPPPVTAVESLNELATGKLGEIVRRGSSKEAGWDGYDEAELVAARELLNRGRQDVAR